MNDDQQEATATVLHGHTTAETAHVTFAYPFGSNRCLRREWLEYSTKGGGKDQFRFVYQTTDRPFNYAYTEQIETNGQAAADAWALERVASARWNAPKMGIYTPLALLIERPLEDQSGRLGVTHVGLSLYGGPKEYDEFRSAYGAQMDEFQTNRLDSLEKMSRRYNPRMWAEYDQERGVGREPERVGGDRALEDDRSL